MAWKSSLKNGVFESKNAVKAILMRFTAFYPLCSAWKKNRVGAVRNMLLDAKYDIPLFDAAVSASERSEQCRVVLR